MSTEIASTKTNGGSALLCLLLLGITSTVAAAPGSPDGERTSVSHHKVSGGRDAAVATAETTEEYGALITSGERDGSDTRGLYAKPGAGTPGTPGAQSSSYDFWFYQADVILFNDADFDGYYYGIDLLFDVDTIYSAADIYAVLYLSLDGGPWNEYAVTEDFTIYGADGGDEYVLVTELMSGYPTGSYDLLIEVFDSYDGRFLTSFGPYDTSELSYLPLEDSNRDTPVEEVRVVVNHGGGGAMDAWLIGALLILLVVSTFRRVWRRRNDVLMRIDSPAPCWRSSVPQDDVHRWR